MKIKLKTTHRLQKSRADLVKVAVQVNGKHGPYQSHRWKNPAVALDLLGKELSKQKLGNIDDLSFKNKESGKKINKNELIKEYQKSKSKETLQNYVKKNYKIVKENNKNNSYKESDNSYNEPIQQNLDLFTYNKANLNLINDTGKKVSNKMLSKIESKKLDIANIISEAEKNPKKASQIFTQIGFDGNVKKNKKDLELLLNYRGLQFWSEAIKDNLDYPAMVYKYRVDIARRISDPDTDYGRIVDWSAKMRLGTKQIPSKSEYKKENSLKTVQKNLENLKGKHTDFLARAAMDMFGLNAPLYVKRNGISFKTGRNRRMGGYCMFNSTDTQSIVEIGVVDHPGDRRWSYKTTIHECMHGLLATTKSKNGKKSIAANLNHRNHEGLVELIATSSLKDFYGKENVKDMVPGYLSFVADTALRLKQLDEFKGKTMYQIGQEIGERAAERDANYMNDIANYLNDSSKADQKTPTEKIDNIIKENSEILDQKASKLGKDKPQLEKSELGELVEELKKGNLTLSQALVSAEFSALAALLIIEFLDDEDEELLALL